MSYPPNEIPQFSTPGGDYVGYDMSQFPVTTGAYTTGGMETATQAAFFDPMYSYDASGASASFDSSCQYNPDGTIADPGQFSYHAEEEAETLEQEPSNSKGESSKKQGKKRPPRQYTAEQLAKRREQNRKAQRTYRDRKDQRIKELEEQLAAAAQQTELISSAIDALRAEHAALTGSPVPHGGGYPAYGGYPPNQG